MSLTRAEIEEFWETWLEVNREAERDRRLADHGRLLRRGRDVRLDVHPRRALHGRRPRADPRAARIGLEMAGLDGWHYDYQATVIDETNGMIVGFWKQRSGIIDDATGKEYEILGIGGSWFGVERQADGELKFAWQRDWFDLGSTAHDVPRDRRRPARRRRGCSTGWRSTARRSPATTGTTDLPSTGLAAAGRARRLHHAGGRPVTAFPRTPAADRRQAGRRERRRDVPDPQPGHRRRRSARRPTRPPRTSTPRSRAARRAFDETDWSTNVELRVRCLRQLHQALLDHADDVARR